MKMHNLVPQSLQQNGNVFLLFMQVSNMYYGHIMLVAVMMAPAAGGTRGRKPGRETVGTAPLTSLNGLFRDPDFTWWQLVKLLGVKWTLQRWVVVVVIINFPQ